MTIEFGDGVSDKIYCDLCHKPILTQPDLYALEVGGRLWNLHRKVCWPKVAGNIKEMYDALTGPDELFEKWLGEKK